ncbi:MAG: CRISPR-associated ring nuclease, partial [Candidatus Promineifilaceae bacterium]
MGSVTMIASMGGQPQVVTFALDALLAQGVQVTDVIVLHLGMTPRRKAAIRRLSAEFSNDLYRGRLIPLQFHLLADRGRTIPDIRSKADADAVWQDIYTFIGGLKQQQRDLHICISGGRRVISVLTMSAAMLHFGHMDKLWHVYSPDALREESREGQLMHAPNNSHVALVEVPMMPWGSYLPQLRYLATPDSRADVLRPQKTVMDSVEQARCRQVRTQLTSRQLDVLRLLAQGLHPKDVAKKLVISKKTVDTHKTAILDCCRNAWELPEKHWLDYHFV